MQESTKFFILGRKRKTTGYFLELRKLTNFVLSFFTIQSVAKHSDQIIKLRMFPFCQQIKMATDSDN